MVARVKVGKDRARAQKKKKREKPEEGERPRDRRLRAASVLNLASEPARSSQATIVAPGIDRPILKTTLNSVGMGIPGVLTGLGRAAGHSRFRTSRYS
jgi:hypothetical protein